VRTAVSVLSALTLWATMSGPAGSSAPISACGALAPVTAPDPDPTVGGDRLTQSIRSATFMPDAGPGAYSFRARMRSTITGKAAGYSPAASIAVH